MSNNNQDQQLQLLYLTRYKSIDNLNGTNGLSFPYERFSHRHRLMQESQLFFHHQGIRNFQEKFSTYCKLFYEMAIEEKSNASRSLPCLFYDLMQSFQLQLLSERHLKDISLNDYINIHPKDYDGSESEKITKMKQDKEKEIETMNYCQLTQLYSLTMTLQGLATNDMFVKNSCIFNIYQQLLFDQTLWPSAMITLLAQLTLFAYLIVDSFSFDYTYDLSAEVNTQRIIFSVFTLPYLFITSYNICQQTFTFWKIAKEHHDTSIMSQSKRNYSYYYFLFIFFLDFSINVLITILITILTGTRNFLEKYSLGDLILNYVALYFIIELDDTIRPLNAEDQGKMIFHRLLSFHSKKIEESNSFQELKDRFETSFDLPKIRVYTIGRLDPLPKPVNQSTPAPFIYRNEGEYGLEKESALIRQDELFVKNTYQSSDLGMFCSPPSWTSRGVNKDATREYQFSFDEFGIRGLIITAADKTDLLSIGDCSAKWSVTFTGQYEILSLFSGYWWDRVIIANTPEKDAKKLQKLNWNGIFDNILY